VNKKEYTEEEKWHNLAELIRFRQAIINRPLQLLYEVYLATKLKELL
jgi:hypothetical protein